ncbi:MAG: NAD(P)-dependent oxidoreductase [Pseudomonadota bacterium]
MTVLITGSSGHLGEALARTCEAQGRAWRGIDVRADDYTHAVGSITDCDFVREAMCGVETVFHTATLHKPHIVTHTRQAFVDVNISGTLTLLEAAVAAAVRAFVFTSTTSTFGYAMHPAPGGPAVWVDETLSPIPKNIYGITKLAAEEMCALIARKHHLGCIILRVSRFFPEDDDQASVRTQFSNDNVKVIELLNRRADLADMVSAHFCAAQKAPTLGFDRFVISAPSPFSHDDLTALRTDAAAVIEDYHPCKDVMADREWSLPQTLDRVYSSARAQAHLDWVPRYTFGAALDALRRDQSPFSDVSRAVGAKGYHEEMFDDGPFPVEPD